MDTMNTTTPTLELTPEQVAAFKKIAKREDFKFTSFIGVAFESDRPTPFTVFFGETERMPEGTEPASVSRRYEFDALGNNEVYVSGEKVRYGEEASNATRFVATQSNYMHGGQYFISAMRSIANVIRPGDRLAAKFLIGNTSEKMRSMDVVEDAAYVSVVRGDKVLVTIEVETRITGTYGDRMVDRHYRGQPS